MYFDRELLLYSLLLLLSPHNIKTFFLFTIKYVFYLIEDEGYVIYWVFKVEFF